MMTASTASGVKRKTSALDTSDDMFAASPPQRHCTSLATPNSPPTISSDSLPFLSDLTEGSTPTPSDEGGTSIQRIETCNFDAAKRDDPRTKAPHCPQRPATELYINMIVGPKVKIVVGPNKKTYELPKELLSYYSPVFDRSFAGKFIESQTQRMELPEDTVEDFEVLIEYIFHHSVGDQLSVSKCGQNTAERCISFLKYADQYDLGDVSTSVYDALRPALLKYGVSAFKPEFIETVFSLTRDGNCLRQLMADAALSYQGEQKGEYPNYEMVTFEKQEAEVEGFESALYRQLRLPRVIEDYWSPFNPTRMKKFEA
ncbi:hypothetical protein SBOR_1819 [Sclerotinia borealis F-4128]|uniref:BTB domain-containing protein n=1 Tax=Sclerotinia borealis (strain F-4128) TaxID=1432307 RepID=W9CTL2_SCLBF|nr:hypothetical protein SBOR_1819 [Sclerotinia borealis F-4128]